jgi:hypothetical protein
MSWWTRTTDGSAPQPDPGATQVVAAATTRPGRSGGFLSLGTVVTVVGALSATLLGGGLASKHSDILDGNTWIVAASRDGVERLLRVNPGSGEVDLDTPSPLPKGRTGTVQQSNVTTAVIDATSGETFAWDAVDGQWQKSTTRVTGDTALHLTATAAFSVDRAHGVVRQLDPATLSAPVGPSISLGGAVSESVVDGSGRLWLAMPATKRVVAVDGSDLGPAIGRRFDLPASGSALTLTALRSGVLAGDATAHTTYRLVPDRDAAERIAGVPPNQAAVSAASSDDDTGALLDPGTGKLTRVTPVGDRRAQSIQLGPKLSRHRFGRPVVFADKVYLPDFSAGNVLRSTTTGSMEAFPRQPMSSSGTDFDLFVDDGRLWVNSRSAAKAFSVDQAGNWTPIAKSDPKKIQPPKVEPSRSTPPKAKAPSEPTTIGRSDPTPARTGRPRNQPTTKPVVPKQPTRTPTPTTVPPTTVPPTTKKPPVTVPPTTVPPTTTKPPTPPGAPENLKAVSGDGSLTITWDPPAQNAKDVTGYLVKWSGKEHNQGANARTFVIPDLTNGTTYDVSITAIGPKLNSEPSTISGTPATTATAAVTSATANGIGRVTVGFTVDGHGSGAVDCSILFGGASQWNGSSCNGAMSQEITGLASGRTYDVTIKTTNPQGTTTSTGRSVTTWAAPSVDIVKSADKPTRSQCSDTSCRFLRITIAHFDPNKTYQMIGHDTHSSVPLREKPITVGADGGVVLTKSNGYFYGFPGESIYVVVGGVKSNTIDW